MKRIRPIWFGILLAALVYAVAARFAELQEILVLFQSAQPVWVALAIMLQVGTYLSSARVYHNILRTLDFHAPMGMLLRLYMAMLFMTNVLPAGGLTGTVYFTRVLKRLGLPEGQGAAASIVGLVTGYLAFFALIFFSLVYLLVGRIPYEVPFVTVGIILAVVLFSFLIMDRLVVQRDKVAHLLEHILEVFHARKRTYLIFDSFCTFMEDLGKGRALFMLSKRKFVAPTLFQMIVLLLDAFTILTVFFAFGASAPFAVILIAYNLARFFGAISFLPGGLGSFEVAQIVALKALGVPLATATVVTLFFRLFAFWLPTPVGLYFYRHLEKNNNRDTI